MELLNSVLTKIQIYWPYFESYLEMEQARFKSDFILSASRFLVGLGRLFPPFGSVFVCLFDRSSFNSKLIAALFTFKEEEPVAPIPEEFGATFDEQPDELSMSEIFKLLRQCTISGGTLVDGCTHDNVWAEEFWCIRVGYD